jgi:hypothetical protein
VTRPLANFGIGPLDEFTAYLSPARWEEVVEKSQAVVLQPWLQEFEFAIQPPTQQQSMNKAAN